MWIKYRKNWNSRKGDWEWIHYPSTPDAVMSEDALEDLCIELGATDQYLDGFRGVEAEQAEPPREVVEKYVTRLKAQVRGLTRTIEGLEATLVDKG